MLILCIFMIFFPILLVLLINLVTFQYLEENYTCIRREWRLLDALSKDFEIALGSVNQIEQRAANHQELESELNLRGLLKKLSEMEVRWTRKSWKVESDAKQHAEEIKRLIVGRRDIDVINKYVLVLQNFITIIKLAFRMHKTKIEIEKLGENKKYSNYVMKILEESRTQVSRLQDRPLIEEIEQTGVSPMLPFRSGVAFVLERLITEKPNLVLGMVEQTRSIVMHLQLLEPFIKDLRGLWLESNIEEIWLEEAQKIIVQAQNDINTFLQEAANHQTIFSDWFLRSKFKHILENVGSEFSHLLETKERYDFNFVRRVSSRGYAHCSVLNDIISNQLLLDDHAKPNKQHLDKKVTLLCSELEDTKKLLRDQDATEGATETRMACFELLKKMFDATNKLLKEEQVLRASNSIIACFMKYLKKVVPNALSYHKKRIKNLRKAIGVLKRFVQVYRITMKKESYSVVGLEEDIHELVLKLTTNSEHCSIISIVGMRGIGKTTLAKKICNHRSIINHFGVCRLVSVHKEYYSDNTLLLKGVGNQIMGTRDEAPETNWVEKIKDFLKAKICLLVLDDLSSVEALDYLLKYALVLEEMGNGSTIMLTTRSKAVAEYANPSSSSIHQLRLRTRDESWELFTQMVHFPSDSELLQSLAKKVVARTGGLPLAILRLGRLLSGKEVTKEELSRAFELVSHGDTRTAWQKVRDNYRKDLQLQPTVVDKCFSYFELFPSDFEIPVRRLVALWVAQGLTVPRENANNNSNPQQQSGDCDQLTNQEKEAHDFLSELICCNMIQIVERKRNGKVKTCCFPSILGELWFQSRRNSKTIRSWSLYTGFHQQLAYRFDDKDGSYNGGSIHGLDTNVVLQHEYPLSILFFDTREGPDPSEDIGNFLLMGIKSGRFQELHVLDLEGIFRPPVTSTIERLKKLTYLGLRWTSLKKLPSSIGKLLDLQTLDLKYTGLQKLPKSIWKLKKLRHLYLNQKCQIKSLPQRSGISMKNLQTLSGVFVDDKGSAFICGLHELRNLKKLRLRLHLTSPLLQQVLATCIQQMIHLQCLTLRSVNENSEPQDLKLFDCLKNLNKLSSLYLIGKVELISLSELPESLTELTLSASQLSGRLISLLLGTLADLPKLKFLSFFAGSYCEPEMVFPEGFSELRVLKLWNLNELRRLDVKKGAMEKLGEFDIRSCRNLEHTRGLMHLKTLQELKLTNMEKSHITIVEKGFVAEEECADEIKDHFPFPPIKIINWESDAQPSKPQL